MLAIYRTLDQWFDTVSNAEVTARTQLPPITDTIAHRHLSLFGHVAHHEQRFSRS